MLHMFTPREAVKRVWSCTSAFAGAQQTGPVLTYSDATFKELLKDTPSAYKRYVIETKSTMDVALRALETHYHGRQLNYDQVRELGKKMDEAIRDDVYAGIKLSDFLATIPGAITVGMASGYSETIYNILGWVNGTWFGIIMGFVAYLASIGVAYLYRQRLRWNYVQRDFEITWYYRDYLDKCIKTLSGLMKDVQDRYVDMVNPNYNTSMNRGYVEGLIDAIRPVYCPMFNTHRRDLRMTPEVWTLCETGNRGTHKICRNTQKKPPKGLRKKWREIHLSRLWDV